MDKFEGKKATFHDFGSTVGKCLVATPSFTLFAIFRQLSRLSVGFCFL